MADTDNFQQRPGDDDIFDPTRTPDKLGEDGRPPAAPADDIHSNVPVDGPATDDGIDSDELYQEGMGGATNADDEEIGPDREPRPLEPED
jgi:hypothetical protein